MIEGSHTLGICSSSELDPDTLDNSICSSIIAIRNRLDEGSNGIHYLLNRERE